eukprot:2282785-Rhodomonas_salina.1
MVLLGGPGRVQLDPMREGKERREEQEKRKEKEREKRTRKEEAAGKEEEGGREEEEGEGRFSGDRQHSRMVLRACYRMSGTDVGPACTRKFDDFMRGVCATCARKGSLSQRSPFGHPREGSWSESLHEDSLFEDSGETEACGCEEG